MDKNEKPKGVTATPFTPDPSETPTVAGLPNRPPKPASKASSKKKPLIILVVVVAVLFIGAAAFGIYWWMNRDFSISPNMVEFESDGGAMRVRVDGPSNWKILDSSKKWVYFSQDGNYLECTVSENLGYERGDTIRIGNNRKWCRFVIKQESGAFVASPSAKEVPATSGEYTFYISGRKDWIVDIGPAGWGSVRKSGNNLEWYVHENFGEQRSDLVKLRSGNKTLTIKIVQAGALRASETALNSESGSSHTKYITISGPEDWDASCSEYWVDVYREGNRLKIVFEKNDYGYDRDGYIRVYGGGQEIRIPITQKKYTSSSSGGYYPGWGWGWGW